MQASAYDQEVQHQARSLICDNDFIQSDARNCSKSQHQYGPKGAMQHIYMARAGSGAFSQTSLPSREGS